MQGAEGADDVIVVRIPECISEFHRCLSGPRALPLPRLRSWGKLSTCSLSTLQLLAAAAEATQPKLSNRTQSSLQPCLGPGPTL